MVCDIFTELEMDDGDWKKFIYAMSALDSLATPF